MAKTYESITSATTTSNATAVTFTGIPGTFTDLILVYRGKVTANVNIYLRAGNGTLDTGSNYSDTRIYGSGSVVLASRSSNSTQMQIHAGDTSQDGMVVLHIMSYANTNIYKSVLSNAAANLPSRHAGLWRSTSAITTLSVHPTAGNNFVDGATVALYGIKAAT